MHPPHSYTGLSPSSSSRSGLRRHLNNLAVVEFNLKNEFFVHSEVRRTVAHAIDVDLLNKMAYHQYAQPLSSPIPATLAPFHDPGLRAYAYGVTAANALLDRVSVLRGSDGKRLRSRSTTSPHPRSSRWPTT